MNRMRFLSISALVILLLGIVFLGLLHCSKSTAPTSSVDPTEESIGIRAIVPDAKTMPEGLAASSNSFHAWYRYPAEEKTWLVMDTSTAYYRDVIVGGETFIYGAADGETWNAQAVRPDGVTINWGNITFYSDYNGQQNCFVSPYWYICGGTSLYVLWYTNSQCLETGTWTMRFYNNGQLFYEGTFKVLPQIEPGEVVPQNQFTYNDTTLHHYDDRCHLASNASLYTACDSINNVHATIANLGCFLTGACMILGYHDVTVDPPTLNNWLTDNNGYVGGGVDGWAVARYARSVGGLVYYEGHAAVSALDNAICSQGPQLAYVRKPTKTKCHHFVTVTGQDEQKTTYQINDPAGGTAIKLSDKYAEMCSIRLWHGAEYQFVDNLCGITITFQSPGELLITDPLGRRTGLDPLTGTYYDEIPNAGYWEEYIEDPDESAGLEAKRLEIMRPTNGSYALTVTGTGDGTYDMALRSYDVLNSASTTEYEDIPIATNTVHTYGIAFDATAGATTDITGGYDGTRQKPSSVNKLLSYITVSSDLTNLPAGTTSFGLLIVYGETTLPATFSALLNDVDVTYLFSPVAGANEMVTIPLQAGSNVLKLSIEGIVDGRQAKDVDLLEFVVQ